MCTETTCIANAIFCTCPQPCVQKIPKNEHVDYSRQAQEDAYVFDSLGQRPPPRDQINGFIIGKQWMGVTVGMWKEDLPTGLILRRELYEDPNYSHWWLDQVLPP